MGGFRNFRSSSPRGGWERLDNRSWIHSGPLTVGKETFPFGGMVINRRSPQRPAQPWAPTAPTQRLFNTGSRVRVGESRIGDQAQRQRERERAGEQQSRAAQERRKILERAEERHEQNWKLLEKIHKQHREVGTMNNMRPDFLHEQQERQHRRFLEQQRYQFQQMRRQQMARWRGSTFLGDMLAGLAPPNFRYPAMRRPIFGAPFARNGKEAIDYLKKREAFAGRFAFENLSFWCTAVAQIISGIISGVGTFCSAGMAARQLMNFKPPSSLSPTSVIEIGAGNFQHSKHLQRMGARVIAVEPDPTMIPANAVEEFKSLGGRWLGPGKTARDLATKSADHVVHNFPWKIGGSGSYIHGGTWDAAEQGIRIAKKTVTFVTEDTNTASYLAKQALRQAGVDKVVWFRSTAGQAAPGASGAGVRGVPPGGSISGNHPVNVVIFYLAH